MTEKKYSKDHEWISIENEIATIGITDHAQESLGDIVFIELPKVGRLINAGDQVGVVESVKAASDLYAPISGEIIEVNNELTNSPQLINSDPENSGWYMKIKLNDVEELKKLMNYDEYKETIK
ncbi:MAG: glycine cleavage system protein GcvH [Pelagibacteraceae bacterium]|jgi:glycine cleavage system H protein|nr:glycine cleavage system protein GcvH [Pelagibacteraceae bacterium]HJL58665.1 glycine cleavage system protein GcvH [Alphaproteobacteria bacterium]MBO6466610.1 glycine cleavage system protein GcvH [Pelagibacteraceae bacterium]MBO6467707.1 glycine cleavage system protein GcvH [Pelagibacteraceae bacterium]MBO6468824.1 glycine cleavage system protein GcvH [Pelagibacteraceae bacterium]|tara:strand:- start:50 stop:418 length:369 start_codon:yes stop_codon:yes gene_type:complete